MLRTATFAASALGLCLVTTPQIASAQPDPVVVDKRKNKPRPIQVTQWGPKRGPANTSVRIDGAGFNRRTRLFVGGRSVPAQVSANAITFRIPRQIGDGQIVLRDHYGRSVTVGQYQLIVRPIVRSFTPRSGPPGTRVALRGRGFGQGMSVTINNRPLKILSVGPREVVVRIPRWARTDSFSVNVDGLQATSGGRFAVTQPGPRISTLSPGNGGPGTVVRIEGTSMQGARAYYGRRQVQILNSGRGWIEFAVPNRARRSRHITVRTRFGEARSAGKFRLSLPPRVLSFAPEWGAVGSTVTIRGRNFNRGDWVSIDGRRASVQHISGDLIRVIVPRGARSGPLAIHRGTSSWPSPQTFTVTYQPSISGILPAGGAPGTRVVISGQNFGRRPQVYYGQKSVRVLSRSRGRIEVAIPSGMGSQHLRVTNRGGEALSPRRFRIFRYPRIDRLSTRRGAPGTQVIVNGRFLGQASGFYVGQQQLPVVSRGPKTMVVKIPVGAQSGKFWWKAHGQRFDSRWDFDVLVAPVIDSYAPMRGYPGSTVVLSGRGFGRDARVWYGKRPLRIVKRSRGRIEVQLPPRIRNNRYLFVESNGMRARTRDQFLAIAPPAIDSYSPTAAKPGQRVSLVVAGMSSTTTVRVGRKLARVVGSRGGRITIEVPRGVRPGARSIWLEDGGYTARSPGKLRVLSPAIVSGFSPRRARPGQTIVIRGRGFEQNARVTYGGTPWPVNRIGRGGKRIWVTVPAGASGRRWIEVSDTGQMIRSPYQLEIIEPPPPPSDDGPLIIDKRKKNKKRGGY